MFSCSQCGFPYRFPGEMVYADDKQFYCLRTCWLGKTVLTDTRERAAASAAHHPDQQAPALLGPKPGWR